MKFSLLKYGIFGIIAVIFSILILSGIFIWNKLSSPYLYAAPSLFHIVENWAPIIKQGTEGNFDFIAKFDYDGNWNGYDNWNNFDRNTGRLHAYAYYAIIESTDHYFITYMFFHPKDVGNPWCDFCSSHENDSESCRMVIKKDGSPYGNLEFLETVAHIQNYRYYPNVSSHPTVYVTPYKHAVYGANCAEQTWDKKYLDGCQVFPSKDGGGIIYFYGRYAELPQSHTGISYCSYDLIDMESTIWARRFDISSLCCNTYGDRDEFVSGSYKQYCGYDPTLNKYYCTCFPINLPTFGSRFGGDDYSSKWGWLPFFGSDIEAGRNAATAPWRYDFDLIDIYFINSHWYRGAWFINPLVFYYGFNNTWVNCASKNEESYTYNPFKDSPSESPPPPPPEPPEPPVPPEEPLPQAYTESSKALTPEPSLPGDKRVVWYWDSKHSFTKNENSLVNWLEGKTIGARIDSNGNLEIEVCNSNFPNVITSPDLDFLKESFDAVRITYLNLMEYPPGKKPEGGIGWVDEAIAEALEHEGNKEGYFTTFPLKFQEWQTDVVKMKGLKYWNWKKNVKLKGLLFTPAYGSTTAQGKFLISSIEIITLKE